MLTRQMSLNCFAGYKLKEKELAMESIMPGPQQRKDDVPHYPYGRYSPFAKSLPIFCPFAKSLPILVHSQKVCRSLLIE